jgi:glycosyltransferase involved in cell wall biosynthesis
MLSIVVFCKTFLKGGAEKQALIISGLLKEKDAHVILVIWSGDKIDPANLSYIKKNSIEYVGLKGNPLSKFIHLLKLVRSEKISIVLSYLTLANFVSGILKVFQKDLITIGGIRTDKFPYYKFIFEKLVHNYLNDATVFNNYSAQTKFVKKGFRQDKIHVIHNAIEIPEAVQKRQSEGELRIITVARFVAPKDFHTALSSFKHLTEKKRVEKIRYYIAGWGPMESEIRTLVRELDLKNEVEILINPPDITGILKSCDIYLSTSLFEGLSNSIMEAMAAGLPVVATNVGDNKYLVRDSFNGFLVPCGDIRLIAEKLEHLVSLEDIRKEFGKNSYSIITEEFSEEKLLKHYFSLFSELADSGGEKRTKSHK